MTIIKIKIIKEIIILGNQNNNFTKSSSLAFILPCLDINIDTNASPLIHVSFRPGCVFIEFVVFILVYKYLKVYDFKYFNTKK